MLKKLLEPYQLTANLDLKNKIIMAPMSRSQAMEDGTPTKAMGDYYSRRADAGLIITGGIMITKKAKGYNNLPGLFQTSHIQAWKKITEAVHKKGGKIFAQLWHAGRVSHPDFLEGDTPISASETTMKSRIPRSKDLFYGTSRAATLAELKQTTKDYEQAAMNAMEAGFDGVELHGANGYQLDQFLHFNTNVRVDEYGGSPENMARFPLSVINACGEAIGYDKVGLRLSPGAYINEIEGDERDASVFKYLLEQLNEIPIAYVHTGNFDDSMIFNELNNLTMTAFMRKYYHGTLIASGGYSVEMAEKGLENKEFNLIAIGRLFIANPDLIDKIKNKENPREYNVEMLKTLN